MSDIIKKEKDRRDKLEELSINMLKYFGNPGEKITINGQELIIPIYAKDSQQITDKIKIVVRLEKTLCDLFKSEKDASDHIEKLFKLFLSTIQDIGFPIDVFDLSKNLLITSIGSRMVLSLLRGLREESV